MTTKLFVTQREPAYSREISIEERWERAAERALTKRRQAIYVSRCHYRVLSSKSTVHKPIRYDVVFTGNGLTGWECSCESGYPTTACWHRAQTLKRIKRHPHLFKAPKPIAPQPRVFREPRPETRVEVLDVYPTIKKSLELREQARANVEHSKRLQEQVKQRRESVGVGATRLEDLYR